MKAWIKRSVKATLIAVAVFAVAFGVLQTGPVKRQIAAYAAKYVATYVGGQVTVTGLRGWIPFFARIESIAAGDSRGNCFSAEDVSIHWAPWEILRGRYHIYEIGIGNVWFARLPNRQAATTKDAAPGSSIGAILSRLRIDRFHASKATVEHPPAPRTSFKVEGGLGDASEPGMVRTSLRIEPLSGPPMAAAAVVLFKSDLSSLDVTADYREAPGGLLAANLRLPSNAPVMFHFKGSGALHDWSGGIEARIGDTPTLTASIRMTGERTLSVGIQGSVRVPGTMFPGALGVLARDETKFSADIAVASLQQVFVRDCTVSNPLGVLHLNGDLNASSMSGSLAVQATLADAAFLAETAGLVVDAPVEITAHIEGPVRQLRGLVDFTVRNPQFRDLHAAIFSGHLEFEAAQPLGGSFPSMRIRGSGSVEGIASPSLAGLPTRDFRWTAEAESLQDATIQLARLTLEHADLHVMLSGPIKAKERTGDLDLRIETSRLQSFAALVDAPLDGELALHATVKVNLRSGSAAGTLDGTLAHLSGVPLVAQPWLGGQATFSGTFDLAEGQRLRFTDAAIRTSRVMLEARGAFNVATRECSVEYRGEAPSIEAPEFVRGQSVSGSASVKGTLQGVWPEFAISFNAHGKNLTYKGIRVGNTDVTVDAANVPKRANGHIAGAVTRYDRAVTFKSAFAVAKESLAFSSINLATPGGSLTGFVSVDPRSKLATGTLRASFDDLGWLSRFVDRPIAGHAFADVKLDASENVQRVTCNGEAAALAGPWGAIDAAEFQVAVGSLFRKPQGSVDVRLRGFTKGAVRVDRVSVSINGDRRQGAFDATLSGTYRDPFTMEARGVLARHDREVRMDLTRAKGAWGKLPVQLEAPARFTWHSGALQGDPLRFAADSGRGEIQASIGPAGLDLNVSLQSMPLEKLPFGGDGPLVSGTVAGRLQLAGVLNDLHGTAEIELKEVRQKASGFKELPPTEMAIDATLGAGTVRVTATGSGGPLGKPMQGSLTAPVRFSLIPFAVAINSDGPLTGQCALQADLSCFGQILLLDDQRLAGLADLSLTIGGTPKRPDIQGTMTVEDGGYEHFVHGAVLKDLHATLAGDGVRLVITDAGATDGGKGTVSVAGWIDMAPGERFPMQLSITLKDAILVRRDDVTATINGEMVVTGNISAPRLSGKVHFDPAEIQLAERAPGIGDAIEVVDKTAPKKPALEPAPRPRDLRARLALDLDAEAPGRIFVRGRGLDSEWKCALHAAGTAAEPAINGTVTLVKGRFDLLGKRFSLTQGAVMFNGAWPVNPKLDVVAEAKLNDLTGYFRFGGTASALDVKLESAPPVPRDEILARLLFNRGLARVSPIQSLQLAEAADALWGGPGFFQFMTKARRMLGVDELDLSVSESADGKRDKTGIKESTIGVGKYVREGVYVGVKQDLGSEAGKVNAQVDITPSLSLESSVGRDSKTGIGLKWKKDY